MSNITYQWINERSIFIMKLPVHGINIVRYAIFSREMSKQGGKKSKKTRNVVDEANDMVNLSSLTNFECEEIRITNSDRELITYYDNNITFSANAPANLSESKPTEIKLTRCR